MNHACQSNNSILNKELIIFPGKKTQKDKRNKQIKGYTTSGKYLIRTKAAVNMPRLYKFLGVLLVKSISFRLAIWTIGPANTRACIMVSFTEILADNIKHGKKNNQLSML